LLFEKKRLEILIADPRILSFKERLKHHELSFSVEWSSSIDGIKLFKMISELSSAISLKYLGGSIIVSILKSGDWLTLALAVLDKTSHLVPKEIPNANR
jgi:transcription-repair coupling factor (superfamily II helicase)